MERVSLRQSVKPQLTPTRLFRHWKRAAGPVFGCYVPAAPFSALATFGPPAPSPLFYDETCQQLAAALSQSLEAQAVQAGEAAFVIDLPGPVSIGLGFYLQQLIGIAPVLLFGGLWRPGALLEGGESSAALSYYGERLLASSGPGYTFLLERERVKEVPPLDYIQAFNNRYYAGLSYFPPIAELVKAGIKALVDLRQAGDEIPGDQAGLYEKASQAGLDVFQTVISGG